MGGPLYQNEPIRYLQELVLNSVSAPITKALYKKALDDFFRWRQNEANLPAFDRAAVQAHRSWLEAQGYAASSINQNSPRSGISPAKPLPPDSWTPPPPPE